MSEKQLEPHFEARDGHCFQILQEQTIKTFEFAHRRAPMRAHTALVLLTARGELQVVHPSERPTAGEWFWKRVRTVYEVDLGQHFSNFAADIPSRGDGLPFHATVNLQWRVEEPSQLVRWGIATSQALIDAIRPELLERMRKVSRQFDVHDSEATENKINTNFDPPLGANLGLWTRPYVWLSLEQSTIDHARDMLGLKRRKEIEEGHQGLLSSRISFYQGIISSGDVEQFAMQIAHNRNDLSAAIKAFHNARNTDYRNVIDFFAKLTESGLIERYEMSDRVQEALDWLNKAVTRVVGVDDRSTSSLTNTGRPRPPGSTSVPPALPSEASPSDQTATCRNADGRLAEGEPGSRAG